MQPKTDRTVTGRGNVRDEQIIKQFAELEAKGLVRLRAEQEQDDYFDAMGVSDDPAMDAELRQTIERDGCWCSISEFKNANGEWEIADSCGFHVGYKNVLDPRENVYVIAEMEQAIVKSFEAHENAPEVPPVIPTGSRVRLIADVERYPHFIAKRGMTGVLLDNVGDYPDAYAVKLDETLKGCEEWDNTVLWQDDDREYFYEQVEAIDEPSIVSDNVEPVDLYEVAPPGQPAWPELKQQYEEALALFERKEFRQAAGVLANLVTRHYDGPALVLLSRAVNCLVEPSGFNPVFQFAGK